MSAPPRPPPPPTSTDASQRLPTPSITSGPSQLYIQTRIHLLTRHLLQRFEEILSVSFDPPPQSPSENTTTEPSQPPSLVETQNKKLNVDVATTNLIRAAEEVMVLTRTMKEVWLFGGLDTLETRQDTEQENGEMKQRTQTEEDEVAVVKGLQEWLRRNGGRLSAGYTKEQEEEKEDETESD